MMAIYLLESFDDGMWMNRNGYSGTSSANASTSYGLHGKGVTLGDIPSAGDNASLKVPIPASGAFTVGFAIQIAATTTSTTAVAQWRGTDWQLQFDGSAMHYHLHINASLTTNINVNSPTVSTGEWHYLEFYFYPDTNSGGSYKWWLDGALISEDTGIDYYYTQSSFMTIGGGGTSWIKNIYVDDIYVTDTTGSANTANLGPIEVSALLPNGNGTYSDLVGSDGNSTDNYLLVDNNASTPPATTEYVGSATSGDKDTYAMEDLSTGVTSVLGMQAALYASKTDVGSKYLRPVVVTGSTSGVYAGDTEGLSESTYSLHEYAWDQNPATSTAWTSTEINGMELGQEVRDST